MLSIHHISRILPHDVWERFTGIEHKFIVELAGLINDPEYASLWMTDKYKAEMILRGILEKIAAEGRGTNAKAELMKSIKGTAGKALFQGEAVFNRAYKKGLLERAAPALSKSTALNALLGYGYFELSRKLDKALTVAAETTLRRIRDCIFSVSGGEAALDAALKSAVNDIAAQGVAGQVMSSGKSLELAAYARRETVTAVMNLSRDCSLLRAGEWGSDLIQVSAHAGARPGCFPYQGRIFSLSGRHPVYPALSDTTYGQPAGLFGINCRHYFWPWIEGLNDEYTQAQQDPAKHQLGVDNNDLYELTQKQRQNERRIRAWKRRAQEIEALGINAKKARAKVRYWQSVNQKLVGDAQWLRRDYLREAA